MSSNSRDPFTITAERIESGTSLTGPQSRGVLRLATKKGGIDVREATSQQMVAIARTLLPNMLKAQGVPESEATTLCESIATELASRQAHEKPNAAASLFERVDRLTRK